MGRKTASKNWGHSDEAVKRFVAAMQEARDCAPEEERWKLTKRHSHSEMAHAALVVYGIMSNLLPKFGRHPTRDGKAGHAGQRSGRHAKRPRRPVPTSRRRPTARRRPRRIPRPDSVPEERGGPTAWPTSRPASCVADVNSPPARLVSRNATVENGTSAGCNHSRSVIDPGDTYDVRKDCTVN